MTFHQETCKLEEIMLDYPIILIDNCALQASLEGCKHERGTIWNYLVRTDSLKYFYGLVSAGKGLYILPETLDELFAGVLNSEYKIIVKTCSRLKAEHEKIPLSSRTAKKRAEEELSRAEASRDYYKARRTLAHQFKANDKVFRLTDNERFLYNYLYKRNEELKQKKYGQRGAQINNVDYSLLIHGAVASQTRKGAAVITRDFPLLLAWSDFMKREPITIKEYRVFIRLADSLYAKGFVR